MDAEFGVSTIQRRYAQYFRVSNCRISRNEGENGKVWTTEVRRSNSTIRVEPHALRHKRQGSKLLNDVDPSDLLQISLILPLGEDQIKMIHEGVPAL